MYTRVLEEIHPKRLFLSCISQRVDKSLGTWWIFTSYINGVVRVQCEKIRDVRNAEKKEQVRWGRVINAKRIY